MAQKKLRIPREEARALLFALPAPVGTESVPLDACCGRVLAEDLIAQEAIPPFAKAPLDGFALRGEDTAGACEGAPVTLTVTEEIAAGNMPTLPVLPGQAAKILTGAPIPEGANAVVRFEETSFTDRAVTFTTPVAPHSNIVPAGDDVAVGRRIAARGDVITPPIAGLLAALGRTTVPVFRRPVVTVISTGSELCGPNVPLPPGKIRNSSYILLKCYMEKAGAEVHAAGIARDDVDVIAREMDLALEQSDMVVTTGGVSVGDYDLVLAAAEKIGAQRLFWKVRFRPGGTMMAAQKGGKLILGLSGNPASASLALHLIGIPFLKKLGGQPEMPPSRIRVRLLTPVKKDSPNGRLVRGRLVYENGETCFASVDAQGNGALTSLLGCNLVADLPAGTPPLPVGTAVDAYLV